MPLWAFGQMMHPVSCIFEQTDEDPVGPVHRPVHRRRYVVPPTTPSRPPLTIHTHSNQFTGDAEPIEEIGVPPRQPAAGSKPAGLKPDEIKIGGGSVAKANAYLAQKMVRAVHTCGVGHVMDRGARAMASVSVYHT